MEALRGFVLSTMETTLIQGEKSRDPGPNCYLSRASSNTGLTDAFEADGLILPMPLKDELELIKSQMQAQAQAFEALSHSLSLLEQESGQQQQKIQHLEGELRRTGPERLERTLEQQLQELRLALSRELEAAQGQHRDPLDGLAEDVMQSKKLLCEELELVQGEMRRIHQKLEEQESDITRNLASIRRMQENQVKCRKILTQLKAREAAGAPEPTGGSGRQVQAELSHIWLALRTLQNSLPGSEAMGGMRVTGRRSRRLRLSVSATPPATTPPRDDSSSESSLCDSPSPYGRPGVSSPEVTPCEHGFSKGSGEPRHPRGGVMREGEERIQASWGVTGRENGTEDPGLLPTPPGAACDGRRGT